MNTYNLDTLSLQYIRRPVDNEARTELSSFFIVAYNEIYRRIMSEKYKILTTETVALDNNKCFNAQNLSKRLLSIKSISTTDCSRAIWERNSDNCVKVHTSTGSADITYSYMPNLLQNDSPVLAPTVLSQSNTPIIPEEYHNIFSLWAAYRYLHSRRKFEDANYYYEMAMELFQKLGNDFGEKIKISVNYMN